MYEYVNHTLELICKSAKNSIPRIPGSHFITAASRAGIAWFPNGSASPYKGEPYVIGANSCIVS